MTLLCQTIIKPTAAFRLLKTHGKWTVAAVFLLLLQVLLILLPAVLNIKEVFPLPVLIVASTIAVFLICCKWFSAAEILNLFLLLVQQKRKSQTFKDALIVIIYSSAVQSFSTVISAVLGILLWLLGASNRFEFISFISIRDVLPWSSMPEMITLLLARVNIFSLWYLFVLTVGIITFFSLRVHTALCSSIVIWLFSVFAQITIQTVFKIAITNYYF